ncbi:MAG: hypothetical protein ACRD29_12920 [Acidimicrobiales bacterium]
MAINPTQTSRAVAFAGLAVGAVALGLAGYVGYVVYPRFALPAGVGAGLLVLAVGAGIGSFFSPCSFPLLVSMLARPLAAGPMGERPPFARAALFASALSVGAASFLALAGALIAGGAGRAFQEVTFTSGAGRAIRIAVGALLILLGLIQTNRLPVNLRQLERPLHRYLRRQARLRRHRPLLGLAVFGFGYILAGFG